jgi:hypothetical protein
MIYMPLSKVFVVISFVFMMSSVQALPMPPVPLEPIYFEPPVEVATD